MSDANLCVSSSQDGSCISYKISGSLDLIYSQSGNEFDYFDALKPSTELIVIESDPSEGDAANIEARSSNSISPTSELRYRTPLHSDEVSNSEECDIACYISDNSGVNVEKHSQNYILPCRQNINAPLNVNNEIVGMKAKETGSESCQSLAPSREGKNPEIEYWVKFVYEENKKNLIGKYSNTRNFPIFEIKVDPNYTPIKVSELISEISKSRPREPPEIPIVSHEVIILPSLSDEILSSYEKSEISTSFEKCITEGFLGKPEENIRNEEEIAITEELNEAYFQNRVNDLSETGISDFITSSESLPKANETDPLSNPTISESSDNKKFRFTPSSEDVPKPTDDPKSSTSKASLDLECELDEPKEEFIKRRKFYKYAYMVFQSEPIKHFSDELAVKYLKKFCSKNISSLPVYQKCYNREVTVSEVSTTSRDDSVSLFVSSEENIENIGQVPSEVGNGSPLLLDTSCVENKTSPSVSLMENVTNASGKLSPKPESPMERPESKSGGSHAQSQVHHPFSKLRKFTSASDPVKEHLTSYSTNGEGDNPPNDTNKGCISGAENISNLPHYNADIDLRHVKFPDGRSAERAAAIGTLAFRHAKAKGILSRSEIVNQVVLPLIHQYWEFSRLDDEPRLDVNAIQESSAISQSANSNSERVEAGIASPHSPGVEDSKLKKFHCQNNSFFHNLDIDDSQIHSTATSHGDTDSEQDKAEAANQINFNSENAIQQPRRQQQKLRRRKNKKGKRR